VAEGARRYRGHVDEPLFEVRLSDALPVGSAVRALAAVLAGLGFDDDAVHSAATLAERLVLQARQREAFDATTASIRLSVVLSADRARVEVFDQRFPDEGSTRMGDLGTLPGLEHIHSHADAQGNLSQFDVVGREMDVSERAMAAPARDDRVDDETAAQVVIRQATPADAEGIVQLVFRVAGYSFLDKGMLSANEVRERLESRRLVSFLAVAPDGAVVGHEALVRLEDDVIPELGRLVVDPRWRGHNLSAPLVQAAVEGARGLGLHFLWAECFGRHLISQRLALALGGVEVGLLKGAASNRVVFAGFDAPETGRISLVAYAIPVVRGDAQRIYLPRHHWDACRAIVDLLGIERDLVDSDAPPTGATALHVRADRGFETGRISVLRIGEDWAIRVADEFANMRKADIPVTYLDIGLDDPAAAAAIRLAEDNYFFWAAYLPDARPTGDVLRLQRIGWVDVDTEHMQYASDFGRQMGEYVMAEGARVEALPF